MVLVPSAGSIECTKMSPSRSPTRTAEFGSVRLRSPEVDLNHAVCPSAPRKLRVSRLNRPLSNNIMRETSSRGSIMRLTCGISGTGSSYREDLLSLVSCGGSRAYIMKNGHAGLSWVGFRRIGRGSDTPIDFRRRMRAYW